MTKTLEKYSIDLKTCGDQDPFWRSPAKGALMHGVLMSSACSDSLHSGTSSLRPYTQHLETLGYGEYKWCITILDTTAARPLKEWLFDLPSEFYVEHEQMKLKVGSFARENAITYSELLLKAMEEPLPKFATLEFITPLIFKRAGLKHPQAWPDSRLIVQSVLAKWNEFSDTSKILDTELLDRIADSVIPKFFEIHSQHVAMDGINMSGSVGRVSYQLPKQSDIRQIFNLIGLFSEYSGIGAKTSLGLGAVKYAANEMRHSSDPNKNQKKRDFVQQSKRQLQ